MSIAITERLAVLDRTIVEATALLSSLRNVRDAMGIKDAGGDDSAFIAFVLQEVSKLRRVTVRDIMSKYRGKDYVCIARFMAWRMVRDHTSMTQDRIAKAFNRQSHDTICKGLQALDNLIGQDKRIAADVATLEALCAKEVERMQAQS